MHYIRKSSPDDMNARTHPAAFAWTTLQYCQLFPVESSVVAVLVPFWDSLACEMRQTLEKLGVLQQDETSARVIS
jgi:hypothetical protein